MRMVELGPYQNPAGVKMEPNFDQVAPQCWKRGVNPSPPESPRETLKHRETQSNLDLCFVYVFRCLHFPILAVQLLTNTYLFDLLRLRHIFGETLDRITLRNPVAAKMAPEIDQVAPTYLNKYHMVLQTRVAETECS